MKIHFSLSPHSKTTFTKHADEASQKRLAEAVAIVGAAQRQLEEQMPPLPKMGLVAATSSLKAASAAASSALVTYLAQSSTASEAMDSSGTSFSNPYFQLAIGESQRQQIAEMQSWVAALSINPEAIQALRGASLSAHGQITATASATLEGVSATTMVGTVSIGTADDSLELQQLAESLSSGAQSIGDLLGLLLPFIQRGKEKGISLASAFAYWVFILVLPNYVANQIPPVGVIATSVGLKPREASKEIQEVAKAKLSAEQRDALRYVSAPSLRAHATPKQKSKVVALLPSGTTVAIRERAGDWALSIYKDPLTGEEAEGWLLVRYLTRFDK